MADGKIISVFNEKGGSGKTTTACQLAGTLGLRGYDVLVADLDPQQTSSSWISKHGGQYFPASVWPGYRYGENIASEMDKLVKKYDVIVADCAPSVEQKSTWGVLLVTDLGLIPTKLNPPDMDALPAAKKMARRAWEEGGVQFPVRVIPNAARMHMIDDKSALQTLQRDQEFPPTPMVLGDRKAYTRSMLVGSTVHNVPKSEDSMKEVEAMADYVLKLLGLGKVPGLASKGKGALA
jgi:chromosome partitioning protein